MSASLVPSGVMLSLADSHEDLGLAYYLLPSREPSLIFPSLLCQTVLPRAEWEKHGVLVNVLHVGVVTVSDEQMPGMTDS